MQTIALTGPSSQDRTWEADWLFTCEDHDPFVVQEVHETGSHVLWELVHVFFEHKGLLKGRTAGFVQDSGASGFLYPFLAEAETNLDEILEEIQGSILQKAQDVIDIRAAGARADPTKLTAAARVLAERFAQGAKVLAFGNGGSATDAQDFVTDLMAPPRGLRPRPALSLTNEEAVITAVGNDVGFDNVYARPVLAFGKPGDVAFATSPPGGSRNAPAPPQGAPRPKLSALARARAGRRGRGGAVLAARRATGVVRGGGAPPGGKAAAPVARAGGASPSPWVV